MIRKLWNWLDAPALPGDHKGNLAPRWWFLAILVVVAAIELTADSGRLWRQIFG